MSRDHELQIHRPARALARAASPHRARLRMIHDSLWLLALALVAGAFLNGCATAAHARGGSRLSDAIDTAAGQRRDGDRKDRDDKDRDRDKDRDHDHDRDDRTVLRVARETPRVVVHHHHGSACYDPCCDDTDRDRDSGNPETFFAGASFDGLDRRDDAIDGGGQFTLRVGGFAPGTDDRFALEGELAIAQMDAARTIADGIDNLYEFTAGGAMRVYASPSYVSAGFYGTMGIRGGILRWDYASPLLVDDGYDYYEVSEDYVATWSPYLGAGVTFFRDRPVQLDVAVLRGLQLYDDTTNEGFHNDVFKTDGFTQVRIGLIGVFR